MRSFCILLAIFCATRASGGDIIVTGPDPLTIRDLVHCFNQEHPKRQLQREWDEKSGTLTFRDLPTGAYTVLIGAVTLSYSDYTEFCETVTLTKEKTTTTVTAKISSNVVLLQLGLGGIRLPRWENYTARIAKVVRLREDGLRDGGFVKWAAFRDSEEGMLSATMSLEPGKYRLSFFERGEDLLPKEDLLVLPFTVAEGVPTVKLVATSVP